MREYKGTSLLEFPTSYTIIDIETTGIDPCWDSIIEVAALRVRNNQIVESFESLINPDILIDDFIVGLTGITNEMLSSAPTPTEVLSNLYDFIGSDIVVGHNIHFDVNFLYDNFSKYLDKAFSNDFVDTLRLSKKYFKNTSTHTLSYLSQLLKIKVETSHRALSDCKTTQALYDILREESSKLSDTEKDFLANFEVNETNPFFNKKVVLKGLPQIYSYAFMKNISEKCHSQFGNIFYKNCDYVVFSNYTYKRYSKGELSTKFIKADELVKAGTLTILSEEQWCKMLNIPIPEHFKHHGTKLDAKSITTTNTDFDDTHPLYNKLCAFTGTLEKMPRKEAMQAVVDLGGQVGNSVTKKTNYLILGNNDYCSQIKDGKSSKQKKAESLKLAGNDIEIISENVFYDMIFDN